MAKALRWSPGHDIPDWMIDKVVIPLAQRGYLTWNQIGIDKPPDGISRADQISSVRRMLSDEYSIAGGVHGTSKRGLDRLGAAGRQLFAGKPASEFTFGDNPTASSNMRGAESGYLQIVRALQDFHRDQGIGQHNVGDVIASGVNVGGRTIAALNPQLPMTDTQILQQEKQRVVDRQALAVQADPYTASNLNQIRHWFPQIPATVASGLAFDGLTINDKVTQGVWRLAINDQANPFWRTHPDMADKLHAGQPISYADINPAQQREMDQPSVKPVTASNVIGSGLLSDIPVVGGALADAANAGYSGVKGAFRWGDAALSAPLEAETGGLRNTLAGNFNYQTSVLPQTKIGIASNELLHGQNVDMGSGFFAQGQVAQDQAANSRAALSVNGHAWTIGRGLASTANDVLSPMGIKALQPGGVGYKVLSGAADFANAYYADPANLALGAAHDVRTAAQVISATPSVGGIEHSGALNAIRRTVNPMTARQYLDSPKGRFFKDWAAGESDFRKILPVVHDVPTARRLTDATTTGEVDAAMSDVLGLSVRNRVYAPPTATGMSALTHPFASIGYSFRNAVDTSAIRALHMKPANVIDVHDPDQAVQAVDRSLQNATTVFNRVKRTVNYQGREMDATEAMARAFEDGRPAILNVAEQVSANIGERLVERGYSQDEVTRMTRLFDPEQARGWLHDEHGNHADKPWLQLDGKGHALAGPQHSVDFLNSNIVLPDAREIKRATSWMSTKAGVPFNFRGGTPTTVLDRVNNVYKGAHALRPALTLRVLADSQLSMALGGYNTIGKHPLDYLAHVIGNPTRPRDTEMGFWQRLMSNAEPRLSGGLNQDSFMESSFANRMAGGDPTDYERAMGGNMSSLIDKVGPSRHAAGMEEVKRFPELNGDLNPAFVHAWAERLHHYSQDPILRYYERNGADATKDWLLNSETGQHHLNWMAGSTTHEPGEMVSRPLGFSFKNPDDVGRYVDTMESDIRALTGGDARVRHLFTSHGKVLDDNGDPVSLLEWNTKHQGTPTVLSDGARSILRDAAEKGDAPDSVFARATEISDDKRPFYDRAVDHLWSGLADAPSRRLLKHPVFSQAYWNRMVELAPYTSAEDGVRIVERARELNAPSRLITKLERATEVSGTGQATWDQVDKLAQGHALDESKRVLYDLTARSQVADSLRFVFPFGDAFRNIAGRWTRLLTENPRGLRRFDQAVTEARQPSLLGTAGGSPTGGFFYSDPTSGEEVFNYPGSQVFNKMVTGVDVPLTGQANALNVAGQGLPGVGFMVAIPTQFGRQVAPVGLRNFIDNSVGGSLYRDWVTKNGELPGGDPVSMAVNAIMPPWMNRLREVSGNLASERQRMYSIGEVERYLVSTGRYSTPGHAITSQQMRRLRQDAGTAASELTLIRAFGSLGLPAAPAEQWEMVDQDGKLVQTAVLANRMRDLIAQEKAGKIPSADQEFVKEHGLNIFGQMAPLSTATSKGLPITRKGGDWVRAHQDIRSDYNAIYGFFAPPDLKGKFDPQLYQQQLDDRERIPTQPEVRMQLANNNIAQQLLDKLTEEARAKSPDGLINSKAGAALAQYRRDLMVEYPGFGHDFSNPEKADPIEVQRQIRDAIIDKRLRDSSAAKGLRAYYDIRDQIAYAYDQQHGKNMNGWDPLTSADGWRSAGGKWLNVRLGLAKEMQSIGKQYPGARGIFDSVFRGDGQP